MRVRNIIYECVWLDKNVDNQDRYRPNFCIANQEHQTFLYLEVLNKRR